MASAERGVAYLDAAIAKRPRFPRFRFDEMTGDEHTDYVVKGIIDKRSNVVVYGESGGGKTFWTIDLAAHGACGIPWRGKRVKQSLVVYVAAEAGASIQKRFAAWRDEKLGEAHEGRIPLVILTRGPNLLDAVEEVELLAALRTIAEEEKMDLGLVVFDTLSRSIPGGDENSAQDMTRIVSAADRIRDELGAATLFVHHSGKDPSRGARGHSALFAAADTVISVGNRTATIEKSRDGSTGEGFPFDLRVIEMGSDPDGDPITTCVVDHQAGQLKARDVKLSDSERIAMAALKSAMESSGEVLPETSALPAGKKAIRADLWRSNFYRLYLEDRTSDAAQKAFSRAKTRLIGQRVVGASDPWVWIW